MSDFANQNGHADQNGQPRPPAPSGDLLAKAAEILGVTDTSDGATGDPRLVMVTVAGPAGRKVLQVPVDVPMGQLAPGLGAEVGAAVVAGVTLHGQDIPPSRTLTEAGVRAGSVIVVNSPDSPPTGRARSDLAAGGAAGRAPVGLQRRAQTGQVQRRSPGRWAAARLVGLGIGVAALIVVSMLIGGATFASNSTASSSTPAAAIALAGQAAQRWLSAKDFTGPRLGSVPADLTRQGGPITASVEAVGFSTGHSITEGLFIVDPATGSPFGLSVVIFKGHLAYPPSVTPLPFATSVPAGSVPAVPQSGKIVAPSLTGAAQTWAQTTFPPSGVTSLALSLAGNVKILDQWKPSLSAAGSGPAMVARVSVALSALLPRATAGISDARHAVTADQQTVSTAQSAVTSASTALSSAQSKASAAAAAAAQPNAPATAAAAATAATNTLNAARQALSNAKTALSTAQQTLTQATATLDQAKKAGATTFASVYDVTFNPAGQVTGWAPADYQIGGNS